MFFHACFTRALIEWGLVVIRFPARRYTVYRLTVFPLFRLTTVRNTGILLQTVYGQVKRLETLDRQLAELKEVQRKCIIEEQGGLFFHACFVCSPLELDEVARRTERIESDTFIQFTESSIDKVYIDRTLLSSLQNQTQIKYTQIGHFYLVYRITHIKYS